MEAKEALAFIKSQFIGDFEMQETDNCWTEEDKKADIKWWKEKFQIVEQSLEKLGKLKNIEEKHGIDLITLFKALENGAWFIDYRDKHIFYAKATLVSKIDGNFECFQEDLEFKGFIICDQLYGLGHELKDYGITWALTKEELENEN